jgi:hypothetical protein
MLHQSQYSSNMLGRKCQQPAAPDLPILDWMIELNITIQEQDSKLRQDGGDDETNCCHPFEKYMG